MHDVAVAWLVQRVLDLANHERAGAQVEIAAPAGAAAQLSVVIERAARRVVGKYAEQGGDAVAGLRAETHAERRQRIGWPAGVKVGRGEHWPAHHGVEEKAGALAGYELLIEALLAELHVDTTVEKRLLVPDLPQPRGVRGKDAAGRLQVEQVVGGDVAAADIPGADVERAALPAEGALGVEADAHQGHAVVAGAALDPAGDVAPDLVDVLQPERDAIIP